MFTGAPHVDTVGCGSGAAVLKGAGSKSEGVSGPGHPVWAVGCTDAFLCLLVSSVLRSRLSGSFTRSPETFSVRPSWLHSWQLLPSRVAFTDLQASMLFSLFLCSCECLS